jgi:chromosome segregation ATPase
MPAAISPAEELKQLQTELEKHQSEAVSLKARIADITKTAGDIEQKNKDFEKAAAAAAKSLEELRDYADCKRKVLEAKVPKEEIAAKKKEAEDKLKALEKEADDAAKAIAGKEAAVANAKANTAAKQKAFDDVSGRRAKNADLLKDIETLRGAIDKQAANPSRAYFLLLILLDRLEQVKLTKPEDYAKELNDAGAALAEAIRAQRTAEQDLEKARAEEKEKAKAFQDEKAKWIQKTLDAIPAGEPAPPAPPPQQPAQEPAPPAPPPGPEPPVSSGGGGTPTGPT